MTGIKTITHRGKQIVCIDWSQKNGINQSLELLDESARLHRSSPEKLRTLDIFTNLSSSAPFIYRAQELGVKTFTGNRKKAAAVGIGELNRVLYHLFGKSDADSPNLLLFNTVEEALDYLGED